MGHNFNYEDAVPEDAEGYARDRKPSPGSGGADEVYVQHANDHHNLREEVLGFGRNIRKISEIYLQMNST